MNCMLIQLSQQSCQQTRTTSCTQQPLNTIDSDNVTPVWAIHLMQNWLSNNKIFNNLGGGGKTRDGNCKPSNPKLNTKMFE